MQPSPMADTSSPGRPGVLCCICLLADERLLEARPGPALLGAFFLCGKAADELTTTNKPGAKRLRFRDDARWKLHVLLHCSAGRWLEWRATDARRLRTVTFGQAYHD